MKQDEFEDVMETARKAIREFINGEPVSYKMYEMEDPDVFAMGCMGITAVCQGDFSRKMPCRNMVGLLRTLWTTSVSAKHDTFLACKRTAICQWHRESYYLDESTANGRPVIRRTGYISWK